MAHLPGQQAGLDTLVAPAVLLLVAAVPPFVHGSFFYVAQVLKTVGDVETSAEGALIALATRVTLWPFIAYGVLAAAALTAWPGTIAIMRRTTSAPAGSPFQIRSCILMRDCQSSARMARSY